MSKPPYAAHTPPDDEPNRWQTMQEHACSVADLAACFASAFGAAELARWCGWLHDVGKYSDAFQQYLEDADAARRAGRKGPPPGTAEHKRAGAWYALDLLPPGVGMFTALIGIGHHGGLPARIAVKPLLMEAMADSTARGRLTQAIERAGKDLDLRKPEASTFVEMSERFFDKATAAWDAEMFARFVFSCLVDADSLDTERHFEPAKAALRHSSCFAEIGPRWLDALRRSQEKLQGEAADTPVNRVRREVYSACLDVARQSPGVFTLTVPTGGGKTRSSLAFALQHALECRRSRIIYAIPYTSIIDQTVAEFRKILGPDGIVEHHSAIEARTTRDDGDSAESQAEAAREQQRRLAAENWDAPLVVTTTVQFFESLFAKATSRCRKVHNIANSVIILDEVQTLPPPLLIPLLDGLRSVVQHYGASVVLCTATQPAFEGATPYLRGLGPITPIITDPKAHFDTLRRVTYHTPNEPWDWPRAATEMAGRGHSALAILNTKKDALALLEQLRGRNVRHLSTLLCGAHRREVLAEVKVALEAERRGEGSPILLVATQVIEAGVDVDFPAVFRARGPLDRIIQAAGRCNREGLRDRAASDVVVFTPMEGSAPPGDYRTAMDAADTMILSASGALDFDDPEVATAYFASLYESLGPHGLDRDHVQTDREAMDYPEVARKVRLIREDTIPVLVPYDESTFGSLESEILARRQRGHGMSRELWQQVQPHTVAIFRRELDRNAHLLVELVPEQLYAWHADYDPIIGIAGAVARDPSDLIA